MGDGNEDLFETLVFLKYLGFSAEEGIFLIGFLALIILFAYIYKVTMRKSDDEPKDKADHCSSSFPREGSE